MTNNCATPKQLMCWRTEQRIPRHAQIKGYNLKKKKIQHNCKDTKGEEWQTNLGNTLVIARALWAWPHQPSPPGGDTRENRSLWTRRGKSLSGFSTVFHQHFEPQALPFIAQRHSIQTPKLLKISSLCFEEQQQQKKPIKQHFKIRSIFVFLQTWAHVLFYV